MKKLFALFIGLAALQTVACADDKPIALKDLPAAAQQFLKQYFPDVKATYAKVDNDLWGKNYDVLMADGSSVEFDKNGNWTDVSCKASSARRGNSAGDPQPRCSAASRSADRIDRPRFEGL